MTIKDDVLAAFNKLSAADDSLWNKDGTPKLEAIRNAADDQKISRDEMIASIGDQRRPGKPEPVQAAPPPAPEPPAADDKPDVINAQKPQVAGVEDTETPDKAKLVAEAQARIAEIDAAIKQVAPTLDASTAEMERLQNLRNKQAAVVEANSPHLSHAEAVKMVQQQTLKNIAANKERMALANATLASAGYKPAASQLDASLQGRKRTPEMVKNMTAYHQQRGAERLKERLGVA